MEGVNCRPHCGGRWPFTLPSNFRNDLATIKAFQPLGKGKARVWRMDDEVMCPDPSSRKWTTSQKLRAQENSPSSPSHPSPNSLPGEKRGDCFNIWAYSLHSLIWHTQNVFCPVPPPWGSEKVARCICGETFFMSDCMPCIPPQTV